MIQAVYIPYITVEFNNPPETAQARDLTVYHHTAFILVPISLEDQLDQPYYLLKRDNDLTKDGFGDMYVVALTSYDAPEAKLLRGTNLPWTKHKFEKEYHICVSDEALERINEELQKLPEEKEVELSDKVLEWTKALYLSKNPPAEVRNLLFR